MHLVNSFGVTLTSNSDNSQLYVKSHCLVKILKQNYDGIANVYSNYF